MNVVPLMNVLPMRSAAIWTHGAERFVRRASDARGSGTRRVVATGVNCPTSAVSGESTPPVVSSGRRSRTGLFALTMMNRAPYHLRAWRDYRVDIIGLFADSRLACG